MHYLTDKFGLDKHVAGIKVAFFHHLFSVLNREDLLGGNQHLENVLAKIGVLDGSIKELLYLGFLSGNGTQNVPSSF